MRRGIPSALVLLTLLLPASPAAADEPTNGAYVLERPAPGPKRGLVSVPAAAVYGLAGFAAAAALAYTIAWARRHR
jgi:hypothetical protein